MNEFKTSLKHPYALKKGILFPVYVDEKSNIVCPVYRHGIDQGQDSLLTYQRISECGKIKIFDKGKSFSIGYWILGKDSKKIDYLLIAEGFSTAAALSQALRCRVAVAYGCNNLDKVAHDVENHWQLQPILCPDVGAIFKSNYPCLPSPVGRRNYDWNDYYAEGHKKNPLEGRENGYKGWMHV